jgi:hypothetical protein
MSLPHLMNFSYLQRTWDAANLTLQDLMSPAVDCAVDLNNRNYPICLNLVLLHKFGIPACGHPMHMKYWKVYKNWMTAAIKLLLALYANLIPRGTVTKCGCEVLVGQGDNFLDEISR